MIFGIKENCEALLKTYRSNPEYEEITETPETVMFAVLIKEWRRECEEFRYTVEETENYVSYRRAIAYEEKARGNERFKQVFGMTIEEACGITKAVKATETPETATTETSGQAPAA